MRHELTRRSLDGVLCAVRQACETIAGLRQDEQAENLRVLRLNPEERREYAALVGNPWSIDASIQWFGQVVCRRQGVAQKIALELGGKRRGDPEPLDVLMDISLERLSEHDEWNVTIPLHAQVTHAMGDILPKTAGVEPTHALLVRRSAEYDAEGEGQVVQVFRQAALIVDKRRVYGLLANSAEPELATELRRINGVTKRDSRLAARVGALVEEANVTQDFSTSPFMHEASWYVQLVRPDSELATQT